MFAVTVQLFNEILQNALMETRLMVKCFSPLPSFAPFLNENTRWLLTEAFTRATFRENKKRNQPFLGNLPC